MSVDNSAILFLGLKSTELDFTVLPDFDLAEFTESRYYLSDVWAWDNNERPKFDVQDDNAYDVRFSLIGFVIVNSGSYGCKEVDLARVTELTATFIQWFAKSPKLYILNYQH